VETMVKVMATGTFDILHLGHIYFLKEAKKLGDQLAVVVATDSTVRRLKHEPVNPEEIRLKLIKELKIVDEAYLGYEDDMYEIVKEIQPDIITLGFDQIHDEKNIQNELKKRNIKAKIVRLSEFKGGSDLEGTRRIIGKIIAAYEFQKNMERIEGK
jgi:FAD synthetase